MVAGNFINLFILGITYGMTVCSLACLPYLGPYLVGTGTGFRDGCRSVITFYAGKTLTYGCLGGAASYLGKSIPADSMNKTVMAGLILLAAISIPFVSGESCGRTLRNTGKRISLFIVGGISGLVPCPPLAAVLILAAGHDTVITGVTYGLAFGSGLAVSPALPLGGLLSFVSAGIKEQAVSFAPLIRYVSMAIMVLAGIRMVI